MRLKQFTSVAIFCLALAACGFPATNIPSTNSDTYQDNPDVPVNSPESMGGGIPTQETKGVVASKPTSTPKTSTPTPSATSTMTPIPTSELPICLPSEKPAIISEPFSPSDIVHGDLGKSGLLPHEGSLAQAYPSYDYQALFFVWIDQSGKNLLVYNLVDKSLETIAHLRGLKLIPSPVSDCIIIWGTTVEEKITPYTHLIDEYAIIDSHGQAYRFDVDETQLNPKLIGDFSWSPEGRKLAFTTLTENRNFRPSSLYIVGVDGSDVTPVFSNEDITAVGIAWSPVKDQIAMVASFSQQNDDDRYGIFLVDVETGERVLLFETNWVYGNIFWSSDGNQLFFEQGRASLCSQLDVNTGNITSVHGSLCDPYDPAARP